MQIKKINYPLLLVAITLFIPLFDSDYSYDFQLPYGYYQLLRFAVCSFGAYAAYLAHQQNKKKWVWILGIIAFLFNPFVKFHFDKGTWQLFDLVAGIIFVIASFKIRKHYATKTPN